MHQQPWLATYRENGIPATVNADAWPSVVHLLDEAMQRYAEKPAFRSFGQTLTYAEVDRLSGAFCAWLQHTLGVKKGDRIAVMLPNLMAFPIACIGILRAKEGSKLVYRCAKQRSEPTSDKRGAKADELHLTPLELIDRIAALVPPPRTHRHRYFGVLAPNSPLRAAVTALAQPAASQPATVETAQPGAGVPGVAAPGNAATPTPEPEARPKRAAHYLWAVLIARIYEAFPLLCPMCGGQMRIIAFITHSAEIRHILNHIGVESAPPHITPARGPPLWEGCDAPVDDGAQGEPDWDLAAQPDEVDQRVNW